MGEPRDYLILCTKEPAHGGYALWWRPNRAGYCAELEGAGRYTKSEAKRICFGTDGAAVPVPVAEAMRVACTVVDLCLLGHEPGIGTHYGRVIQ